MRNYIVASWNDADQFDYSGEMLGGSRLGKSQRVHFNPDGTACTASYADDPVKPLKKTKEKPSLVETISLPDRHLNRLEKLSERLEAEAHTIDIEEYAYLRRSLDERLEKAQRRLFKARKWEMSEKQAQPNKSPTNREIQSSFKLSIENYNLNQENFFAKFISIADEIILSCSDSNCIKQYWNKIRRYWV